MSCGEESRFVEFKVYDSSLDCNVLTNYHIKNQTEIVINIINKEEETPWESEHFEVGPGAVVTFTAQRLCGDNGTILLEVYNDISSSSKESQGPYAIVNHSAIMY